MFSAGAYIKTVLTATVDAPSRHCLQHLSSWRYLLGSIVGSLLVCSAVNANPLPATDLPANLPTTTVNTASTVNDGVYLYGSVPEPDSLGAAYIVFSVRDTHLIGALFMPQSSFDCFQGQRIGNELAMQITNSYTQEVYGYEIALVADDSQVASASNRDFVMQLDGFHYLGMPGEAEMAILSTCQANYPVVEGEI